MQRLNSVIEGESPYDTILSLAEQGLVHADSFVPVRQWINREKLLKGSAKQRVSARVEALTAGRWEVTRPFATKKLEDQIDQMFDKAIILCRETAKGLNWSETLEILRIWEYTGRVRRGYFIEGLSGVQYIRDKEFSGTMQTMEQPGGQVIWLSAIDPAQLWGKVLTHLEGRSFINVPGIAVAIYSGMPVAVFERQGKVLRVFDSNVLHETMKTFVSDFQSKCIYPASNRIVVKDYPIEALDVLKSVGFLKEMQDLVLYRS